MKPKELRCTGIWWCNSHRREATYITNEGRHKCDIKKLGGITIPCHVVFVEGVEVIVPDQESEHVKNH